MTEGIDTAGAATVASAEGQAALDAGDTTLARERFAQSGRILENRIAATKDRKEEHLLRFLAATQFYKGGHYVKALEFAGRVKAAELPGTTADLLPAFLREVAARASPMYEARAQDRLQELWAARDYPGILDWLVEHPYIITPGNLAFIRAVCCEELGKYRPAVLFFADAARRSENSPKAMAALAPLPINLAAYGSLEAACHYSQAQLELWPNAVSYAVASIVCYKRAFSDEGDARTKLLSEQGQYLDSARQDYAQLPAAYQENPVIRDVLGLAYDSRAWALHRIGSEQAALNLCELAISFDPASPSTWSIVGVIRASASTQARLDPEATAAFRKAVEFGDKSYASYYYLAHDAMTRGEFRDALALAGQALARGDKMDPQIASLLYEWQAISLAQIGGSRPEIDRLFKKAIEVAPDNERAKENYRMFVMSGTPQQALLAPARVLHPRPEGNLTVERARDFKHERMRQNVVPELTSAAG